MNLPIPALDDTYRLRCHSKVRRIVKGMTHPFNICSHCRHLTMMCYIVLMHLPFTFYHALYMHVWFVSEIFFT